MKRFETCLKELKIPYCKNQSMAEITSFHLGGPVQFFVMPNSINQLVDCVKLINLYHYKYFVIGNGSNVLFKSKPSVKVVLSLQKMPRILYQENLDVHVSANINLFELHKFLKDNELGGLEFAFGIPATVGGAIKCNAGAFGGNICDFIKNLTVFDVKSSKIQTISRKKLNCSYRKSNIDGIILNATFSLNKSDFFTISILQNDYFLQRKLSQPYDKNSAGSIFKHDGDVIPAKIIDQLGLKGLQMGGAMVSTKHAGFIVKANDKCTSEDVVNLIKKVKEIVYKKRKIRLKEEIIIV